MVITGTYVSFHFMLLLINLFADVIKKCKTYLVICLDIEMLVCVLKAMRHVSKVDLTIQIVKIVTSALILLINSSLHISQ